MAKRKDHNIFVNEVFELVGEEYTVMSKYVKASEKIKMKHNICNTEYNVVANSFIQGTRCPECFGKNKNTTDNYKVEVFKTTDGEFEAIGEYINSKTKILFKHNSIQCNNCEFEMTPNDFSRSNIRCPVCRNLYKRSIFGFTKEEYQNKLNINCNNEILIISEYINASIEARFKHNIKECGFEWDSIPSSLMRKGAWCPKCSDRNQKRDTDLFKEEVYELVGDEYEVLGEYTKTHGKILMKHNLCNSEYMVTPAHFMNQRRCPICDESRGEQKIRHYYENNKIYFEPQYKFDDLKGLKDGLLKFDFATFYGKNKILLNMLIEYDGEFHYFPIMGEEALAKQQYHDELKNEYCRKNNITLLRIPYWEFENVEEILHKAMNNIEDITISKFLTKYMNVKINI